MLTGTSWRFSVRFVAVTTTSARPPPPASDVSSAAWAAGMIPNNAEATGAARQNRLRLRLADLLAWRASPARVTVCLVARRRNFLSRLRVTNDSPYDADN